MISREVWPGRPYPLGATYDGAGTNFSLYSELATSVELCLVDASGKEECISLPETTAYCWHAYLPRVGPGQRYGYRVHGPWNPKKGQRCSPQKMLIDPYARAIDGDVDWNEAVFTYRFGGDTFELNDDDSGPYVPLSVVTSPYFDWGRDSPLGTPFHETIIYELHVKGFTKLMQEVPEDLRGTYAGLAHPAAIGYLKELGITAVELMPIHHFVHDHHLVQAGKRNYWGYNTIGFFAPYSGYAAGGSRGEQVQEFKQMVKALHAAGIEVILDVVYNHSAEGNQMGPTLSMKGIDNPSYYRLTDDRFYYKDYTGTGNTYNMRNAHVLQLIMDSLRYWAGEMHVDGFRFDLAATLAREFHDVDRLATFFDLIHQDPICRTVKLIAEPWDLGEGGYQVGNFPPLWTEWNGKFRDTVRDYWRGEERSVADMASRLTGSSDLYQSNGRRPYASINLITAHDGFTLDDLVSFNDKHNLANGEHNRDGESHNRSWNCGVEGPTDDEEVNALRRRQRRNLLATLLLAQGVPMLVAGDELGRSQHGNNNAYAQDNELSWIDWAKADKQLVHFVHHLIKLRRKHITFRRRRFFEGRSIRGEIDLRWLTPDGSEMTDEDWQNPFAKSLAYTLSGQSIVTRGEHGERLVDDDFTLLFNAWHEPMEYVLPAYPGEIEVDTSLDRSPRPERKVKAGERLKIEGRSVIVVRHVR